MANLDEYYSKGEKLYSDFATGADVFDPKHPDVGMFDKEGQYSQKYLDTARIKIESSSGNMTPRSKYFQEKRMELGGTLPTTDDKSIAMMNEMRYGNKPRYSKTDNGYKLVSPYTLEKEYRSSTKDMDPFAKMDFDRDFSKRIKSMPTDTTSIERKVMDSMLKEDEVPWQEIEDPVARLKARYK